MIARIGEHNHLPDDLDPNYASGIRAFLAAAPASAAVITFSKPKLDMPCQ